MATEVNFYHLTRSSLEDALPRLLTKTLQAGERAVVMLGSPERVDALTQGRVPGTGFVEEGAALLRRPTLQGGEEDIFERSRLLNHRYAHAKRLCYQRDFFIAR